MSAAGLDDNVVPVELARVDVQAFSDKQLMIPGLQLSDFALSVDGKVQSVRSFESDKAPMDVLFLLDVSGRMKPHIEQLAEMAEQAMRALTEQDRMGIMVFDVNSRPYLPLTGDRGEITQGLKRILTSEHFVGGARVTSSMIAAAAYLQRHARPEARRAIVILTDNATQDSEDELRVERALQRADALLSFLFAGEKAKAVDADGDPIPDAHGKGRRQRSAGADSPGRKHDAPPSPWHSAGTEAIAQDAGGDAAAFENEDVLEDTLLHLRQRYILRFDSPDGPPQDKPEIEKLVRHEVKLDLSSGARVRYPAATLHFRLLYTPAAGLEEVVAPVVGADSSDVATPAPSPANARRRRTAVNEDSTGPDISKPDPPKR
jgi:VWFA-related protein